MQNGKWIAEVKGERSASFKYPDRRPAYRQRMCLAFSLKRICFIQSIKVVPQELSALSFFVRTGLFFYCICDMRASQTQSMEK